MEGLAGMASTLQSSIMPQVLPIKAEPTEEAVPQGLFEGEQHAVQKQAGQNGEQVGLNTDSPLGMPTPPNVQHPPPPAGWQSDGFSPDGHEAVPMSHDRGAEMLASQQNALERQHMQVHMPLSPFKNFAPPGSGSESSMGQQPQVASALVLMSPGPE